MRKINLLAGICISVLLASCGGQGKSNGLQGSAADSSAMGDSESHSKLVRALVKDTNRNNYTDANGKRQGHWLVTNASMHLPGYDSNGKVEEGFYNNNMKEGEWIEYNADGTIKSRTAFKDDKPIQ